MVLQAVHHRPPRPRRRAAGRAPARPRGSALTPSQDLALCARLPGTVTSARSVPWQPPSITPSVGSISTAKSPASQLGVAAAEPEQAVALGLDLLAVVEDVGDVAARRGQRGGQLAARPPPRPSCREVPQPYSRSPSTRLGRLPATGTVSRCPAITTRSAAAELGAGHDRVAVAVHASGAAARRAPPRPRPPAPARAPLTDSMSTSRAVSVPTSCVTGRVKCPSPSRLFRVDLWAGRRATCLAAAVAAAPARGCQRSLAAAGRAVSRVRS